MTRTWAGLVIPCVCGAIARAGRLRYVALQPLAGGYARKKAMRKQEETIMAWTTPTLIEICIGLEINGYLPAEF